MSAGPAQLFDDLRAPAPKRLRKAVHHDDPVRGHPRVTLDRRLVVGRSQMEFPGVDLPRHPDGVEPGVGLRHRAHAHRELSHDRGIAEPRSLPSSSSPWSQRCNVRSGPPRPARPGPRSGPGIGGRSRAPRARRVPAACVRAGQDRIGPGIEQCRATPIVTGGRAVPEADDPREQRSPRAAGPATFVGRAPRDASTSSVRTCPIVAPHSAATWSGARAQTRRGMPGCSAATTPRRGRRRGLWTAKQRCGQLAAADAAHREESAPVCTIGTLAH